MAWLETCFSEQKRVSETRFLLELHWPLPTVRVPQRSGTRLVVSWLQCERLTENPTCETGGLGMLDGNRLGERPPHTQYTWTCIPDFLYFIRMLKQKRDLTRCLVEINPFGPVTYSIAWWTVLWYSQGGGASYLVILPAPDINCTVVPPTS